MSSDDALKIVISILLAVLIGVAGMLGWFIKGLHTEVTGLREDVHRLTVAVEVQAGGNPFTPGG